MNFKNSSTITRIISHFFKKQENRKRRKKWQKEKTEDVFSNLLENFSDTSKQESSK